MARFLGPFLLCSAPRVSPWKDPGTQTHSVLCRGSAVKGAVGPSHEHIAGALVRVGGKRSGKLFPE